MGITELNTNRAEIKRAVMEKLDEAKEEAFDEVIILGMKDRKVYILYSGCSDYLRLVGALEEAKHHVLSV